jgi:hypothetical protein
MLFSGVLRVGKVKRLELWWQLYLYVTSGSRIRKKTSDHFMCVWVYCDWWSEEWSSIKVLWRKIREVTNGQATGLLETGSLRIRRLCVIKSRWFLNNTEMQYESVGCTITNYAQPSTGMQKEVLPVLKSTDSKFLSTYICFSFLHGDPITNQMWHLLQLTNENDFTGCYTKWARHNLHTGTNR